MDRLATTYSGETVAAVSHAGFIVVSILDVFKIPRGNRGWLDPIHTGMTRWEFRGTHWKLEAYNDANHLVRLTS
jgi:broad specificity phosphatase PhoE